VDFSEFSGKDVLNWIKEFEKYFDTNETPELYKTRLAIMFFTGDASDLISDKICCFQWKQYN
jgi:hypothetical protein